MTKPAEPHVSLKHKYDVLMVFPDAVLEYIALKIYTFGACRDGHYILGLTVYGPIFKTRTEERAWELASQWIDEYSVDKRNIDHE